MKIEHFKQILLKDKERLEEALSQIGRKNPDQKDDWEPRPSDIDVNLSDENDMADVFESLEENSAIMTDLEKEWNEINDALKRIESNKYGICSVCNKKIEEARLEAYPAAQTCIEHK